ncbi:MAG: type 4a pilus biogenesis protein PilO [Clostridia bacterium]|nr:type 4a pilus biogenesis protein PilO [Clostridia bacterium]
MRKEGNLFRLVVGLLIYLMATGGVLVAGFNFLSRSREYADIVQQKEAEFAMVRRRVEEDLPRVKEEYNKYYQLAKDLRKFVPSREEQERVVVSIEQLANSAGIKLRSCKMTEKPKAVKGMPAYQIYTWEISCSGRYLQMDRFMALLDRADRLMKISGLSVLSESGEGNPRDYTLDIKLKLDLIVRTEG